MYTRRTITWLLVLGSFILLLSACATRHVPAVATHQSVHVPQGTTLLAPPSASSVFTVAWSPDGTRLALGDADGSVQIRNATTGSLLSTVRGHLGHVWSLAWSPDSTRLASASWDHTVQVWDAGRGSNLLTYRGHTDLALTVAWSPDGTRIASGSWDTTVQIWNAVTGQHLYTYDGHADIIGALVWSPDGQRIASVDDHLRVWQAS